MLNAIPSDLRRRHCAEGSDHNSSAPGPALPPMMRFPQGQTPSCDGWRCSLPTGTPERETCQSAGGRFWRATGFARWEPSRARGSGHSAFRKRKYLRTKSPSRPGSGASQTRQGTLTINGLWSSLGSDKVIKRIAIRAVEIHCRGFTHGRRPRSL